MEQRSGTEIGLGVPPVAGARGATAGAENALVHPVELLPLLLALQNLFSRHRWVLPLQPGLDTLILIVEVRHVHDQVLDHECGRGVIVVAAEFFSVGNEKLKTKNM